MTRELALVIVLALLAWALFALWRGWRSRVKKYGHLPPLTADVGPVTRWFDLLYVATTEVGKPMERVAVAPLAFRGKARVGVAPGGVVIDVVGEGLAGIPAACVVGTGLATWTIDKAVDPDGLIFLRWTWGELAVESYFRVVDHPRDEVLGELHSVMSENKGESSL
jgi:hypothetical protein